MKLPFQSFVTHGVMVGLIAIMTLCPLRSPSFGVDDHNQGAVSSGTATPGNLSDEEIRRRVDDLQKQLDELKDILKQRQIAEPSSAAKKSVPTKPSAAPQPVTAAQKFRLSGYIQLRAFDDQTTTNGPKMVSRTDQFNLRRGRLELTGDLGEQVAGRLTFDIGATGFSAKDVYLDVKTNPALLRFGQFKIPFDYEILQSASDLMALERSLVNQRLFPGNRDRGIMADMDLSKSLSVPLSLKFGVLNGTGQNQSDNDESKDVFGVLAYTKPHFQGWVSGLTGGFTFSPTVGATVTTTKRRVGVSFHGDYGDWDFHGQYTTGHGDFPQGGSAPMLTGTVGTTGAFNNNDVAGWYLLCARKLHDTPFTFWGKYEAFDPNTNVGGNLIRIGGLGTLYDVNRQLRFTLGVFRKDFNTVPAQTSVGFQSQVKF